MITIQIRRFDKLIQIITDNWQEIFNLLETCKDVTDYKAFNCGAQFLPEFGYDQYHKLVKDFDWRK